VLSCVANDYGYTNVFSRQLDALADQHDILVAITTSGRSPNILHALATAKRLGMQTICLSGNGAIDLDIVDIPIVVPSISTARIQEAHILIGHIFCELIERELCLV